MKIAILAIGSLGDVRPLAALGVALRKSGHEILAATHAPFKKLIVDNGLGFSLINVNPRKILENMGAKDIYSSWLLAAHPGGSVKIGEHLDMNLMTQVKNLYVCDCSVIPEELGLPPTFTLLSLGKRLAKHLMVND